jgi:predicted DNA-binding transcriptional regulator YafY
VDEDEISEMVLWTGPLVEVIAPESLRERIRNSLANALNAHT